MCTQRRLKSACASPSLIRVFAVRSVGRTQASCWQRKLWSDWADAQADLSLRWAHMTFCRFCRALSQSFRCPHEETLHPWLSKVAQWRFWLDCAYAQAELNLQWALMSEGRLTGVAPHTCMCPEMSQRTTKPTKWHVHTVGIQISLGIRPVWSESSLCAQWVTKDRSFLHADSEESDQTGRMPRLIWVFAGRTCHFVAL